MGALLHYCDSSLLQLENFQMSADAANTFVLLNRAALQGKAQGPITANKTLLSREKRGTRVLQDMPTLKRGSAPVMLASQRLTEGFQTTLRCLLVPQISAFGWSCLPRVQFAPHDFNRTPPSLPASSAWQDHHCSPPRILIGLKYSRGQIGRTESYSLARN